MRFAFKNMAAYLLPLLLVGVGSCSKHAPLPKIRIFAAASTGPALDALKKRLKVNYEIVTSVAASSTVARQVENGAECDLVLVADEKWMDYLEEKDCIVKSSRAVAFRNRLVIVVPKKNAKESPLAANEIGAYLENEKKIAIADPSHVPAGRYAKEVLSSLGLYEHLKDKMLFAPDVRAALLWVERGEAQAGIVYETDAKMSTKIFVAHKIDGAHHEPIVYPMALCKELSREAVEATQSKIFKDTFKSVFKEFGFV